MSSPCPTGGIEITINSTPQCLPAVRAAIMSMATTAGFTETDAHAVAWAIDEALANVIKHGYGEGENGPINVGVSPVKSADGRGGLRVQVRDFGRQVDPSLIRGRDLEDVRPGGLGVHIIRSVMDEVTYAPCPDRGMLLTMTKHVPLADNAGTKTG